MKTTKATWTKCSIEFTAGPLDGLIINEWIVSSLATVGKRVKACAGSARYVVRAVGESVDTYSPPSV